MALATVSKKSVVMSMLACVLAAASVACGSADGEHPYMSESSVSSAASTPTEEVCTPGTVEACRQFFTAYGTTNCIPGERLCGEDAHWGACGQEHQDAGAAATAH